jgi:peptidoglycan/LPS O-acetylase OafA/YrhL
MGFIRLLLSISVIFGHIYISNKLLLGGPIALEAFFVISGFTIAYIYQKKYLDKPYLVFITSRLLKILPLYYFILVISIIVGMLSLQFKFKIETALEPLMLLYFSHHYYIFLIGVLSNIIIIGQDIFLVISRDVFLSSQIKLPPLYLLLIIPQSWALAIEFWFYLIAPVIFKMKQKYLFILFLICLMLRYALLNFGLKYDPWIYRFFLSDLVMIILGIYSYQLYKYQQKFKSSKFYIIFFIGIIFFTVFYRILPVIEIVHVDIFKWIYIISLSLCIPSIFIYFSKNYIDKLCSGLSYHVYLWHILIIQLVYLFKLPARIDGILVIIITLGLSLITYRIFLPLERYKQKRVELSASK